MEIKTKYQVGDKLFTLRDNKIELVSISNFKLTDDRTKTLEERLRYVIPNPPNISSTASLSVWYTGDDIRSESQLFLTVEELLENLKNEYNRQS